nr:EOG090X08JJ [Sida crystallina]
MGREMTRKMLKSDDEDSDSDRPEEVVAVLSDNPWMGREAAPGYRKLWTEINDSKDKRREINDSSTDDEEEEDVVETEDNELANEPSEELEEGLQRRKDVPDFDSVTAAATKRNKTTKKKKGKAEMGAVLSSSVPATEEGAEEEEGDDGDAQRRMTIAEAFADEDVMAEFREEKRQIVESSAPKAVDLTLPGWGDWGGSGLKVSRRKKKRFIIKAPPAAPRRDDNRGHLIINEEANAAIRSRQVSELPFPFRSVGAFESVIRAPVTATFIPETAVRKLAEPKVVTKMGTVIEPMTEDAIVKSAHHEPPEDASDPSAKVGKRRKSKKGRVTFGSRAKSVEKKLAVAPSTGKYVAKKRVFKKRNAKV